MKKSDVPPIVRIEKTRHKNPFPVWCFIFWYDNQALPKTELLRRGEHTVRRMRLGWGYTSTLKRKCAGFSHNYLPQSSWITSTFCSLLVQMQLYCKFMLNICTLRKVCDWHTRIRWHFTLNMITLLVHLITNPEAKNTDKHMIRILITVECYRSNA